MRAIALGVVMLCPDWCSTEHGENSSPSWHYSSVISVPSVLARAAPDGRSPCPSIRAAEVELVIKQHDDEAEPWVHIGPEDDVSSSLLMSVESAARMASMLGALLADSGLSSPRAEALVADRLE